jgi:hypothetical protein
MAKARSPQYPAIGLKEAVDKVKAVYDNDYQNPIPRSVAVTHMGYFSLNGKSLGVLSALLKYGLLEGRGDDTRVSDQAVSIIAHPPGSSERVAALKEAAAKPELFSELDARFQGGKASDQAVRSYLLTQRFIPTAADAVIRSYRETKQLVEAESGGYNVDELPEVRPMSQPISQELATRSGTFPPLMQPGSNRQTITATVIVEKGVSQTSISIQDERVELFAVLYDQVGVQKVIDRLNAIKGMLPEKPKEEAAN